MKKSRIILISIAAFVGALLAAGAWFYLWSTSFSGDIAWKSDSIPAPMQTPTALTLEPLGWPEWLGPTHNNESPVTGIQKDWSHGLKKVWEIGYLCKGAKAMSWSCPAIRGNRLVVPGRDEVNDYIFCLDPENGKLIWLRKYPIAAKNNYGQGQRATPTIDMNNVYTVSREGDVRCHALYDGTLIWEFNITNAGCTPPEWGSAGSPLVYKDRVILHAGGGALAIALDKKTGALLWKSRPAMGCYSTPALMNIGGIDYAVILHKPGISFIHADSGKAAWDIPAGKFATEMMVTTPAVYNEYVFASTMKGGGSIVARVENGRPKKIWQNDAIKSYQSNPVIKDGYIYCYSGMPIINSGSFVCAELATGKKMWETDRIGHGTSIYADGHIICLDIQGNLFLVKPDPKEFILVSEIKHFVPEGKKRTWTKPIIANDKLYIRHGNTLACYRLK